MVYSFINKFIDIFNVKDYKSIIQTKGPGILFVQGRITDKGFLLETVRFIDIDHIKENPVINYPPGYIETIKNINTSISYIIYVQAYDNVNNEYYSSIKIKNFN